MSTSHNFWRERRAEAVSNRGPSAYQPTALPLGQTGSLRVVAVVVVDRFYTAVFSALEQTHCALVAWDSKRVTIFFKWCTYSAIWLYRVGATREAVSARCVCTIQSCTMSHHFMQSHIGACVFNSNLPPAPLADWPGSFTCYCGNTGVERIPKYELAQKVDPGEQNSHAAPAGTRTRDLLFTSPAL